MTSENERFCPPCDLRRIIGADHSLKIAIQEMASDLASPSATHTTMRLLLSAYAIECGCKLIKKISGFVEFEFCYEKSDEIA